MQPKQEFAFLCVLGGLCVKTAFLTQSPKDAKKNQIMSLAVSRVDSRQSLFLSRSFHIQQKRNIVVN